MANENVHIKYERRECRVTRDGWYGPDEKPVAIGQKIELPMHDALHNRALGRIEFV